jgi:N-acetylglucosaminyl-diphospho-decaprenol L-rhamnosyltransferase
VIAVIVVSWNVRDLLRACLQAALADIRSSALDAQVWVVDNASSDGSAAMVRAEFPDVRLLAAGDNLGFAAGNNRALRALGFANSKFKTKNSKLKILPDVLLLNPDTEVRPGALRTLVDFFAANPRAGVAGAQLCYGDGRFQHGAFAFPRLAQLALDLFPLPGPLARLYETRLNGRYPRAWYAAGRPFPIGHPLGAAMLVRGAAIAQAGLMDEGYHMYCEEIDWCLRLRAAGWPACCVPRALVVHHAGQSTRQVAAGSLANLWISRARLYARHYDRLTVALARVLVRARMGRLAARETRPEYRAAYARILEAWA